MRPMGRRRTKHHNLPPLMHFRRGRYYYGHNQLALGADFASALRKYAVIHTSDVAGPPTFAEAAFTFMRNHLSRLARSTQHEYERQAVLLVRVFGAVPLEAITPAHVERYLEARGRTVSATREKALLSTIFNVARRQGLTNAPNPCTGVRGIKGRRERYVTDAELRGAIGGADPTLAAFLELSYRTGQRPSDVLRMTRADVQDGALCVRQGKTGTKLRIAVSGPLAGLLARLTAGTVGAVPLVRDQRGQRLTLGAIRKRWHLLRARLGADWQLRDLRAKAASDLPDVARARGLLGHRQESTTDGYRRARIGELAAPVEREIAGNKD